MATVHHRTWGMHRHVLVLDRVRLVTLPIRPRGRAAINAFSRSGTTEAGAVVVLLVSMEMGDWDLPLQVQAGLFAQSSVPARYLRWVWGFQIASDRHRNIRECVVPNLALHGNLVLGHRAH